MLNPLLIKELRMQARGKEIYAISGIYILALSVLTFTLVWEASTGDRPLDVEYGKEMLLAFFVALMLAVCLICPAFTVGSISSERERLTFNQLRVTLLKPHQILVGKAAPSLIYILTLLFASLPIVLLIVPLSGLSLTELASCYLIALISALTFSLVGLTCSAIYRNTRASTVMTFATIGLLMFGTAVAPMILTGVFRVKINRILLDLFMSLNPFYAVLSVLGGGKQIQMAGLSPWSVTVTGYLAISAIAVCVSLFRFKRMRG